MSDTSTIQMPVAGQFSWNELMVSDLEAAKRFYGGLFGWESVPFRSADNSGGMPPYSILQVPGANRPSAGIMQTTQPGQPTEWLAYVVVENADVSLARAVELGAEVCLPVMTVPTVGRIAVIQDPQGARLGLHELP